MRVSAVVFLTLALFGAAVMAFDEPSILHVSGSTHDLFTEKPAALLFAYADDCAACKKLQSPLSKAAKTIAGKPKSYGLSIAAIDCSVESSLCDTLNIKEFPALQYFEKGVFKSNYDAATSSLSLLKFARTPSASAASPVGEEFSAEPHDVNILTPRTFDSFVKANPSVLVFFHAPWCSHCVTYKPVIIEAAAEIKDKRETHGVIAAVECEVFKAFCGKHKINSFPTIKYFANGEFSKNYEGARTKEEVVDFMEEPNKKAPTPVFQEGSDSVAVITTDEFDGFIAKNDAALLMFYAPYCGHCTAAKGAFSEAADKVKEAGTGVLAAIDCTSPLCKDTCTKYGVNSYPTFKFFNKGALGSEYNGGRDVDSFVNFMASPPSPPKEKEAPAPVDDEEALFDGWVPDHEDL